MRVKGQGHAATTMEIFWIRSMPNC